MQPPAALSEPIPAPHPRQSAPSRWSVAASVPWVCCCRFAVSRPAHSYGLWCLSRGCSWEAVWPTPLGSLMA